MSWLHITDGKTNDLTFTGWNGGPNPDDDACMSLSPKVDCKGWGAREIRETLDGCTLGPRDTDVMIAMISLTCFSGRTFQQSIDQS